MLLGRICAETKGNAALEKKEKEKNPNLFLRMATPRLPVPHFLFLLKNIKLI